MQPLIDATSFAFLTCNGGNSTYLSPIAPLVLAGDFAFYLVVKVPTGQLVQSWSAGFNASPPPAASLLTVSKVQMRFTDGTNTITLPTAPAYDALALFGVRRVGKSIAFRQGRTVSAPLPLPAVLPLTISGLPASGSGFVHGVFPRTAEVQIYNGPIADVLDGAITSEILSRYGL